MERLQYDVGDIVKLKKPHPCGSQEWEILRVGADFRLKCQGCGHQVMVPRKLVEKNTRGLTKKYKRKGKGNGYEKNIIAALFWDRYQKEIFLTMYNNII